MTASTVRDVDAAPTWDGKWHSIDWAKCHLEVRKLQVRIAKATREGKWRKVKALQWLLTHSLSAKALAVRRVTENRGKKTPGVDQTTWSTPEAKAEGVRSLKRSGYNPRPLRRLYIPKLNNKLRPLGIPAMKDRAMQALHLLALEPVAETTADWNSYGFRPGRSTHDAIEQVFILTAKPTGAEWVLEGDIKGCFDHISHEWMLNNITTDTQVLKKWLESGVIEQRKFYPTTEGTPQGSIVSPTLSNLVLDGLEDRLSQEFGARRHNQRLLQKTKVHLVRYADDFIITGSSKELLEGVVKPMVKEYLAERGLQLSEEKTRITHISEGFDFLGWNVRKFRFGKPNSKLLIRPSKKNVKAFLAKVRNVVSRNKTVRQDNLIQILNPMIQGWANYHRHVVASKIFGKVDAAVWWMLWRWAVRRHPKKNTKWVRKRYFGRVENRASVFKCLAEGRNGWLELRIRTCSEVAIKRHVKIQAEATAFNPRFEAYFEARQSARMENHLAGHRKLLYLWRRQDGRCPICGEPITKLTRWHVHHLVRQVDGGSDSVSNLCLVHPTCHHQHHANPNLKWKLPVEPDGLT